MSLSDLTRGILLTNKSNFNIMGAFGRLLIQHWGGNIDSYEGNKPKPKEEAVKEESCECGENTKKNCPDYYCKGCCRPPHNCVCSHED